MISEKLANVLAILDQGADFELLDVVPQFVPARRSVRVLGLVLAQRPGQSSPPDPRT